MVCTHQGAVRAFLRRLCQNTAEADDLAQEVFIKAMGRMDDVNDAAATKGWLLSIAYHHFIDRRRTEIRRATIRNTHAEALIVVMPHAPAGLALDLTRAMNALPDDCRACVMLVLSDGMSHAEAAEITQLPLGTVKSHVTRGRGRLKAALAVYRAADVETIPKPAKVKP